jgi:hypothetical protein
MTAKKLVDKFLIYKTKSWKSVFNLDFSLPDQRIFKSLAYNLPS